MSRFKIAILGEGRPSNSTYWSEQGQLMLLDGEAKEALYRRHDAKDRKMHRLFTTYSCYLENSLNRVHI